MMGEVRQLLRTEQCSLCGDNPGTIYADLDMVITYRDEPNERYRSKLKVCIECSDMLTITRTSDERMGEPEGQEVLPFEAPSFDPNPGAHLPPVNYTGPNPKCVRCGRPAAVMTSSGLRCSGCIGK